MTIDIDAHAIIRLHDGKLARHDWPGSDAAAGTDLIGWIEANHRCNTLLWNEEDKARRTDVDAGEIAACKLIERTRHERFDLAVQLHGGGRYSNPFIRQFEARVSRACHRYAGCRHLLVEQPDRIRPLAPGYSCGGIVAAHAVPGMRRGKPRHALSA